MKIQVDLSGKALMFDRKTRLSADWETLAECLAGGVLSNMTSGPTLKMLMWCYDLGDKKKLELDEPDFKTLYDLINNAPASVILKGQILVIMDNAKDTAKALEDEKVK